MTTSSSPTSRSVEQFVGRIPAWKQWAFFILSSTIAVWLLDHFLSVFHLTKSKDALLLDVVGRVSIAITFCSLMGYFLWRSHVDIRTPFRRLWRDVTPLIVFATVVLAIVGGMAFADLLGLLLSSLDPNTTWTYLYNFNWGNVSLPVALGWLIGSTFLAPFGEELMFRGVVLASMRRHGGSIHKAIFKSAVVFTLGHPFHSWPNVFIFGVLMGYMYLKTSNIAVTMTIHGLVNFTLTLPMIWAALNPTKHPLPPPHLSYDALLVHGGRDLFFASLVSLVAANYLFRIKKLHVLTNPPPRVLLPISTNQQRKARERGREGLALRHAHNSQLLPSHRHGYSAGRHRALPCVEPGSRGLVPRPLWLDEPSKFSIS